MYRLHLTERFHHMHMPRTHDIILRLDHLVRDSRFWLSLALLVLLALIITLAILTGPTQNLQPGPIPPYPLFR